MSIKLSRITKVNPGEVWKHEALEFKQWLENIAILYEELEINLENVKPEAALGSELEWMELPDATASRILVTLKTNPKDRKSWNESFEWCTQTVEKFSKTFKKYTNN